MIRTAAAAVLSLLVTGCGQQGFGKDTAGFTKQESEPARQAVLRSIATYRTTADERLACTLVSPHFLKIRFDGKKKLCEALARSAQKRELPESATVESFAGDVARVRVKEPTPVRSIYAMRRVGGTWKIDDITEAP